MGRSRSGIDWNSPDGQTTHFIFLILTPKEDDDIQVQILRIIAIALSDKKTRDAIMGASDREAIWRVLQEVLTEHQMVREKDKTKGKMQR